MEHYSEHESTLLGTPLPLWNESQQIKRESDAAQNENGATNEKNKSKRKRRSSLASTRRSITGNLPSMSNDDFGSDLPSSSSSSNSSQPQIQSQHQNTGLRPNPLNTRMDEIIIGFEENIARLEQERAQWKLELKNLETQDQQMRLLSESDSRISSNDIPQDIKELAKSEYLSDLIDFKALSTTVEKGLLKSYFDIRKCLQDMTMFRTAVDTIKCHNKYAKASLSPTNDKEDFDFDGSSNDDVCIETSKERADRHLLTDIKSQLEWMMSN